MSIQYHKGPLQWNQDLFDADLNGEGLIVRCQKSTNGAPATTAGKFIPRALVQGTNGLYVNVGTTASVSWQTVTSS